MTTKNEAKAVPTVDHETALNEFERFADAMDIDIDESEMDEKDREEFSAHRDAFVKAVRKGLMHVNDNGEPVYQIRKGGEVVELTFREPVGADIMQMDKRKKGEDITKSYTTLAAMTRQPLDVFAKMRYRDLKVCQSVMILFMA